MDDESFISLCLKSNSMLAAAAQLKISYRTFKKRAQKLKCFFPNQGGKGTSGSSRTPYSTKEILDGFHPHFQTFRLKNRLLKEGILKHQCSQCGITEWRGKFLAIELDHIDGDRTNHKIQNLRMLCPNCHSQTPTFRSKKRNGAPGGT